MASMPMPLNDVPVSQMQEPVQPPTPPAAPPAPPAEPQFYLEVNETTRYRTPEDAVHGFTEAQRAIEQYKSENAQLRQVAQQLLGQTQATTAPPFQAPSAPNADLVTVLEQAVQTGNRPLYNQALEALADRRASQIVDARLQQYNGYLQPVVSYATFQRAVERAAATEPNIPAFVASPAFQEVLKREPLIANAIEGARNNPVAGEQTLPQILNMAYRLSGVAAPVLPPQAPRPVPASSTPPQAATTARQEDGILDIPLNRIRGWQDVGPTR